MKVKRLFMETTKISPQQTVGQIQGILGKYGAGKILTEYEDREVSAVSFTIDVNGQEIPFSLPCKWKAIHKILTARRKKYHSGTQEKDIQQAKRIAWRQILRWVEAQLALVSTNMVKMQEVFMPYIKMGINQTFYEKLEEEKFKMIEHKERK